MTIRTKFLAYFRDLFATREKEVRLPDGARLLELLNLLCDSPERRTQVFSKDGQIHHQIVVMRNGTPVQSQGGLEAPLQEGDIIAIFPFLGGG
jgi:MoaD family protein